MFDILKWLEDAPIKLVAGVGDPESGGCWMSALSLYSGDGWSDHPDCVCPLIRRWCISVNDMLPDDKSRGEVIQPHILEPVGTKTDDPAVIKARVDICVSAAFKFAMYAQRAAMYAESAAAYALYAAKCAKYAEYGDEYAEYAAKCAKYAEYGDEYAAAYALYAAKCAEYAAADAESAAAYAESVEFVREQIMPVVLEMCKVGNKAPVEMSCDEMEFKRSVQCQA